tara:strand:+ start:104 stop:631 length:528 start_codon:yes stop_codon:yes gene_type:complete
MANPMYGQNKEDNAIDKVKGLVYHDVAATSHTNTTDAADISSYAIPTGDLQVGSCIKVRSCINVTDQNGTDTATAIVQLGSVSGTTSGAVTVADSDKFYFDVQIVITKMGSAGTAECFGYVGTDATGSTLLHADNVSMTAIDFSGTTVNLGINVDHSAAHSDNELTHQWTTIELS